MDRRLLAAARAAQGFMPEGEGLALYRSGCAGARVGPLLEVGSYCGKSAVYLGAAARRGATVLFSVDHHRGSEENQPGWEYHDPSLVDPRVGKIDTLPYFRATIHDAGLEDTVIAVVGESTTVAAWWGRSLGFVFIDGGHAEEVAQADYSAWAVFVSPGGLLAIHDVFERFEEGGQGPFRVWERAVRDGFEPETDLSEGSLRVLRRS